MVRFDTWQEFRDQWGDASVRMPVFETIRANASVTLVAGRFDLVSVLTPKPTSPDSAHRDKALVFVRADILTVRPPAAVGEVPAS